MGGKGPRKPQRSPGTTSVPRGCQLPEKFIHCFPVSQSMTVRHQLGPRVLEKLFHQVNQRICSSIPKRAGKQSADPVWELYLSSPHCKWAILTSQWLGCVENSEQMVKRWRITQLCSRPWHPHCGPDTARGCGSSRPHRLAGVPKAVWAVIVTAAATPTQGITLCSASHHPSCYRPGPRGLFVVFCLF